ncbi:hypothetical protein PTSG_13135 [Salpingoeca rosetta]|uniref:Ubiquitin-activating enzyme SCCH domain-containing protein n=1 Tax=Salpingoeca rosetta (strain ATCC 50818 / BSB-021) TaxID=946362 RepID=F2USI3_SALR5|nr:uncharacterized protein PTSG_13135 [Salpingoeca rosetta]EGD81092.1 hypothetical protein PTSG_13135 [Salpingoeca rosetta]|eukprot:XP_004987961.1 hypothetical protein PTSG_13135 [Salpingoeca rosetta]
MGTDANVDVIVPHTTNSCSDGGDAEAGGGIPMCTLHNFPHLIDHCIEWARAKFADLFVSPASQLQQFLEDPEGFTSGLETKFEQHVGGEWIGALERGVGTLKAIKDLAAQLQEKPTMETCVSLAWRDFHAFFRDVILQLIANFPRKDQEWRALLVRSSARRSSLIQQNPLHKAFLIAATNLYACVCKVHPTKYPSEENKLHTKRPPGSCPSEQGGYSYVNTSPDGRLLVAESFVWDMHRLACKQRVPVTATDMVWTKDGRHLICPSYSRVNICGLGAHEAERTLIFEDPFPGAELACTAVSDGVIERWQKLGQPSTLLAEWRADAVGNGEETIQDADGEAARGQQHNMKGQQQWRQQQQQKQQRQQQRHAPVCVGRATLAQPKEVTGVRVPHIAALADSSNKLASACGNTLHVYVIEHRKHDDHQQDHQQQQQRQQQQQQHVNGSSSGVSSALTRVAVLDDLFVDEVEPNANMTVTTMATHPTDDSLLAIGTARGDVVVCDVANRKVLSKLKVSRNVPVKYSVFARHSSILFVNSVESVIKCDYSTGQHSTILHRNDRADDMAMCDHQRLLTVSSSVSRGRVALWALGPTLNRAMIPTQQFDLHHLRPTTDPRCRPYAIVPIVVPPATPPADAHKLDDYISLHCRT